MTDTSANNTGASVPPPKFDHAFEPRYGVAETVAPHVQRIVCNNPSPFTFKGTGTFIIRGASARDPVAVLDPGPQDEAHLAALLAALDGRTVSHVIVSHTHRDHSPLAAPLARETGARIVGCAPFAARRSAGGNVEGGLDAANDTEYSPHEVMHEGDAISIGANVLSAVATPGHTSNHLAFSLNGKLLFSGDHVMAWSTTVIAPPDGHMRSYMQSLEKLLGRDETLYLPAHGGAVTNPNRFVRGLVTHRRQRETQILKRLREGDSDIAQMVPKLYPDLDPRLHPAAALSVRAHIDDLIERGIAVSEDGGRGFRLA